MKKRGRPAIDLLTPKITDPIFSHTYHCNPVLLRKHPAHFTRLINYNPMKEFVD